MAASRAVVFASLVPDPDDPRCPEDFRDAVEYNLKTHVPGLLKVYQRGRNTVSDGDPYRPYDDLPDTLRNRLLTFIAKWSPEALAFETGKSAREPEPAKLLDDRSLVKWETSDPENRQGQEVLRIAQKLVNIAHGGRAPVVLDPFAGGGAIPLEAGRLGCQPIANDYNPVAYLILRGTCEFPQKYGKPGKRKILVEEFGNKTEREIEVPNVLVHDFEKWAKWILKRAQEKIGHLYPPGKDGRPVIGYLWARTAPCSNPSCQGEMPLLRSLLVCNKRDKKVALVMEVDKQRKDIRFGIAKDKDIKQSDGTMQNRGNVLCPYCGQVTPVADLRTAGIAGQMGERMVAVIVGSKDGKNYRPVEEIDLNIFSKAYSFDIECPNEAIEEKQWNIKTWLYGMKTWGSLFNPRQLVAMQTFVECLKDAQEEIQTEIPDEKYRKAVEIYLGLWISRMAMRMTSLGRWDIGRETMQTPFDAQAIPMKWDYPEANPFTEVTGGVKSQLKWIVRFLKHEQNHHGPCSIIHGDGAALSLENGSLDITVTDPPYFDAIAYADISDFFYVWLKRSLSQAVPEACLTPLTPKTEEATALKHRQGGNAEAADRHFTLKLSAVLAEAKRVTKEHGIITVMFAHQSTKAWIALINALFKAGLSVDATWPIDTELKNRSVALGASALESSITVICRPRVTGTASSFKEVRREIYQVVQESVKRF